MNEDFYKLLQDADKRFFYAISALNKIKEIGLYKEDLTAEEKIQAIGQQVETALLRIENLT